MKTLVNFTFSSDGQQTVMKLPGQLPLPMHYLQYHPNPFVNFSRQIVCKNIAFCPTSYATILYKSHLLLKPGMSDYFLVPVYLCRSSTVSVICPQWFMWSWSFWPSLEPVGHHSTHWQIATTSTLYTHSGLVYRIALIFRGSLISRIWNRS